MKAQHSNPQMHCLVSKASLLSLPVLRPLNKLTELSLPSLCWEIRLVKRRLNIQRDEECEIQEFPAYNGKHENFQLYLYPKKDLQRMRVIVKESNRDYNHSIFYHLAYMCMCACRYECIFAWISVAILTVDENASLFGIMLITTTLYLGRKTSLIQT